MGVEQEMERRFEHRRDFARVGDEDHAGRDDAEHGGDFEAGDGAIAVGEPDHFDQMRRQSDLFLSLAQSGGDRAVVVGIDPPAGEADLARMLAHRFEAKGEDHRRFGPVDHRDQHRRGGERVAVHFLFEHVRADQLGRGAVARFERGT